MIHRGHGEFKVLGSFAEKVTTGKETLYLFLFFFLFKKVVFIKFPTISSPSRTSLAVLAC